MTLRYSNSWTPSNATGLLRGVSAALLLSLVLVQQSGASSFAQPAKGQETGATGTAAAKVQRGVGAEPSKRHRNVQHSEAKKESRAVDAAAPPAKVTFQDGVLTVHAEDADLREILKQVAGASGMVIDGSVQSSRVYGDYGPGDPLNVLTDLLAGSGYNFLMVGARDDGAPRELLLTQKSGEPLPPPTPQAQQAQQTVEGVQQEQLGPGAIPNVPPPPSEDPQVRMQQNTQRLQQMHDHQAEPQQPQ